MTRFDVLVVEDRSDYSDIYLDDLTRSGYTARLAADLRGALDALEEQRFDAAIVDLALTDSRSVDREGESVLRALQALKDETPALLVTATSNIELSGRYAALFGVRTIEKGEGVPDVGPLVRGLIENSPRSVESTRPNSVQARAALRGDRPGFDWEHAMLAALPPRSGGIDRLASLMATLVSPVWPLVSSHDRADWFANRDGLLEGRFWSRHLAESVILTIGSIGQIEDIIGSQDVFRRHTAGRIAAVSRIDATARRDQFLSVVPHISPSGDDDWLTRL